MAIIGIDLGTTNSLVCVWRDHRCIVIPNALGEFLTPSIVSIQDDEILVGKVAMERLVTHPDSTFSQFKSWMGTNHSVFVNHKEYKPEDLSSFVIRKLVEDAKVFLQEDIEEAIISVPAYFNDDQRWATKNAGRLAGVKVERLINEPSAAALSYHMDDKDDKTFLVVDFGGGTLDISVVEAFDNVVEISAISGNNHLGGKDFDQMLFDAFLEEHHLDLNEINRKEQAVLLKELEQMKYQLSESDEVKNTIKLNNQMYEFILTNAKMISICGNLLQEMKIPLSRVMNDAQIDADGFDDIILVGGSCKMPIVIQYLEHVLNREVSLQSNADMAIAIGCGVAAGIKARNSDIQDIVLSDICPFTLGIEIYSDEERDTLMSMIIERNTPLPSSIEQYYYTSKKSSDKIDLKILQGEHRFSRKNLLLKTMEISLPRLTKEEKKMEDIKRYIMVRFTYDINGILEVEVKVAGQQETQRVIITNKMNRMSEEEIEARITHLQKFKIPPHELEINKSIIERGERLFYESIGSTRDRIDEALHDFEVTLNQGDPREIRIIRKRITALFNEIEFNMGGYQILH